MTRDDFAPRKPGEPVDRQPVSAKTVGLGLLLTLGLHVLGVGGMALVGALIELAGVPSYELLGLFPLLFIGGVQLLYMIPAWIITRRRGLYGAALGLVIGGSITFLLNSACFGMLIFNGIH